MKALTPVAPAAAATLPVWMGMNISSGEREKEKEEKREAGIERRQMRENERGGVMELKR